MPTPIIKGYANLTTRSGPEVPYRFAGQCFRVDAMDPSGQNRALKYTLVQGDGFTLAGNIVSQAARSAGAQITLEVRVEYQAVQPGDYAATWLITAFAINEPPIFSAPKSLREDGSTTRVGYGEKGTLILQVVARDPEALPVTFGFVDPNTPGAVVATSGPFGLEPGGTLKTVDQVPLGLHNLNVRAVDQGGAFADRVFTIQSVNRPPVDLHLVNLVGGRGAIVQLNQANGPVFQVMATDLDQSPIAYKVLNPDGSVANVPGLTLDGTTGIMRFTRTAAVPGNYPVILVAGDPDTVPEAARASTQVPVTIQVVNDKPDVIVVDDVSTTTQRQFLVRAGDPDQSPPPTFAFANQDGSAATSYQGWSITAAGILTPDPALPTDSYALPIRILDGHQGITIHWVRISYDAKAAQLANETVQQLLKRIQAAGNQTGANPDQKAQRYPTVSLRRSTKSDATGKTAGPLTMVVGTTNDQGVFTVSDPKVLDAGGADTVAKQVRLALEYAEFQQLAGTVYTKTAVDPTVQAALDKQRAQTIDTPPLPPADPAFPTQAKPPPPTGYEKYR